MAQRLVVVVTGANSGAGFGVCHRLLVQLSSQRPLDAQPYFVPSHASASSPTADAPGSPPTGEHALPSCADGGLTIIMACRHAGRAKAAQTELYALLDDHISTLKPGSEEHQYATAFRSSVKLEVEILDLASMKSVLDFGKRVAEKYDHISHLVLNAGTAVYSHFDYLLYSWDIMRYPTLTVTHPRGNVQKTGVLSEDNLGYAWQCDVFGHYCVYRLLQPLLATYARVSGRPARVIWISSMDAMPTFDPADDWQLTKTPHSYEGAKFEAESIASELEQLGIQAREKDVQSPLPAFVSTDGEIHHLISGPGVVPTNMMALLGIKLPGYRAGTTAVFWLSRLLGCKHVHMSVYKAAIATVHLALVPLDAIPTPRTAPEVLPTQTHYPPWHLYYGLQTDAVQTLRFGSRSTRWGHEYPGFMAVPVWEEHPDIGKTLLEKFERLYQTFRTAMLPDAASSSLS